MPTISIFFGFVVQMYWREHPPPQVIAGSLPPAALRIFRPWIEHRRAELLANWDRGRRGEPFERVAGADVE